MGGHQGIYGGKVSDRDKQGFKKGRSPKLAGYGKGMLFTWRVRKGRTSRKETK